MTEHLDSSYPSDICLLLWAFAEQLGLTTQVVPVLSELEHPATIPEDQLGAALAYLEVLWIDAARRSAQTDAAYAQLDAAATNGDRALHQKARTYHAAVRDLRRAVARRVARAPAGARHPPARPRGTHRSPGAPPEGAALPRRRARSATRRSARGRPRPRRPRL